MGTSRMNTITFFGLFFFFIGPSLSFQCYICTGGIGGLECDDGIPEDVMDCSGQFASDFCILSGAGDIETRECGIGNLADLGLEEGCTEETFAGVTVVSAWMSSVMKLGKQLDGMIHLLRLCKFHP